MRVRNGQVDLSLYEVTRMENCLSKVFDIASEMRIFHCRDSLLILAAAGVKTDRRGRGASSRVGNLCMALVSQRLSG